MNAMTASIMPVPLMIHVRVMTCDPAVVTDVVAGGTRPALRQY
jgi:hypothetical protein